MIANLFVDNTPEKSRYLEGTLSSFKITNKIQNVAKQQANSLLDQLKAYSELSSNKPYGFEESEYLQAGRDRTMAERLAKQDSWARTLDSHEAPLAEMRDDIDQAAEEATAPENTSEAATQDAPEASDAPTQPKPSHSAAKATAVPTTLARSINIVV